MDALERRNLAQIEALNQRGSHTLSVVDLVAAGTVSCELMAYCWAAVARGASFLTAALPGGAGKSTVLANLLAFLPAGEQIVTYGEDEPSPAVARTCHLAHEIGSGHYYGYLWGGRVREFLALPDGANRVASCLHADTMEQLRAALCEPPLGVPEGLLGSLGLILFIHVGPGGRRRVVGVWETTGGAHQLSWAWDASTDTFRQVADPGLLAQCGVEDGEVGWRADWLRGACEHGPRRFGELRQAILGGDAR